MTRGRRSLVVSLIGLRPSSAYTVLVWLVGMASYPVITYNRLSCMVYWSICQIMGVNLNRMNDLLVYCSIRIFLYNVIITCTVYIIIIIIASSCSVYTFYLIQHTMRDQLHVLVRIYT